MIATIHEYDVPGNKYLGIVDQVAFNPSCLFVKPVNKDWTRGIHANSVNWIARPQELR